MFNLTLLLFILDWKELVCESAGDHGPYHRSRARCMLSFLQLIHDPLLHDLCELLLDIVEDALEERA